MNAWVREGKFNCMTTSSSASKIEALCSSLLGSQLNDFVRDFPLPFPPPREIVAVCKYRKFAPRTRAKEDERSGLYVVVVSRSSAATLFHSLSIMKMSK